MANPTLTADQLKLANVLLSEVRRRLEELSDGDASLLWALRRKVSKELTYDERGKPMHRRKLKAAKRAEQNGLCLECKGTLPTTYCVLDRIEAIKGYTATNTRLLCKDCDTRIQMARKYR